MTTLFVDDDQVAALSKTIAGQTAPDPALLLDLAWCLRQRDTRRALSLLDDLMAAHGEQLNTAQLGRAYLIQAEAATLFADYARASELLGRAEANLAVAGDPSGVGDYHYLAAGLAFLLGEMQVCISRAQQAADSYERAGERANQKIALAVHAINGMLADPNAAELLLSRLVEQDDDTPPVHAMISYCRATHALLTGDDDAVAAMLIEADAITEQFGMVHLRLTMRSTLGTVLADWDEHNATAHFQDQTLALARDTGWPISIGDALAIQANLARAAGEPARAMSLLAEADRWLQLSPDSYQTARAQCYLSRAELAAGRPSAALPAALRALRSTTPVIQTAATLLAAQALAGMGRLQDAWESGERALTLAEQFGLTHHQVHATRLLAELSNGRDPSTDPMEARKLLSSAATLAANHGAARESAHIYTQLSKLLEQAGDTATALVMARRATEQQARAVDGHIANLMAITELIRQVEIRRRERDHLHDLAQLEARRAYELESSLSVLENLGQVGRQITSSLELGNVLNSLVEHLGSLMQVSFVGLSVLESNGKLLVRRGVEDGKPMPERRVSLDDPNSATARCARERREILDLVPAGQRSSHHVPGTRVMQASWFGPLLVGDDLVGVLTIQSANENAYGEREQLILRTLSAYVAVAVANARAYTRLGEQHARLTLVEAEMRRLATTDALTNIPNRRQFLAALSLEVRRSRRTGRAVAVIMADIDHFKSVNDTHGHAAGDAVLTRVARILDTGKRALDTVGRLGGEEFAVLLPETDIRQAAEVADRLRGLIEAEQVMWESRRIPVTISFGCAVLDLSQEQLSEASQIETLLQGADRALYAAKNSGRNRTAWTHNGHSGLVPSPIP
ncbi:MAG: GGDEF domain-containing protein [Burkholderiales bacterium]|nr:GGDEF domain-containing protein [Burkholderiales bacterium]